MQQRRELKDLDSRWPRRNNRWLRVQQARQIAPTTTGDFAARIALLQARMATLRAHPGEGSAAQSDLLARSRWTNCRRRSSASATTKCRRASRWPTIYDRAAEAPRPADAPKAADTPAPAEAPK